MGGVRRSVQRDGTVLRLRSVCVQQLQPHLRRRRQRLTSLYRCAIANLCVLRRCFRHLPLLGQLLL
jgi:hypothetical protein